MSNRIRYRGDTRPEKLVVTDKETGAPEPITGCSLVMTFNTEREPTDTINQKGSINGVITDAAVGEVEFPFDNIDILGHVWYDVQLTDAQGKTETIAFGRYRFKQDISK